MGVGPQGALFSGLRISASFHITTAAGYATQPGMKRRSVSRAGRAFAALTPPVNPVRRDIVPSLQSDADP